MTLLVLALSLLAAERPVPPPGVNVPDNDRKELEAGLRRLTESANKLAGHALEPDVLIYREAVRYALTYNEFFKPEEIARPKTCSTNSLHARSLATLLR